jgi:parallel beta-helix repeat protein
MIHISVVNGNTNRISKKDLLLAVLVLSLSIGRFMVPTSAWDLDSANISYSQNYTTHDPIHITNDDELAAAANGGSGGANNPFIIANWKIIGSNTDGIYVAGTTKFFRIENCWISDSTESGIHVVSVVNGTATIANNTCSNNERSGIKLEESDYSTIANNTCSNNQWSGIYLEESGYSALVNNTCTNNTLDPFYSYGIYLEESGSSTVANNTCSNNRIGGIYLLRSSFSTVTNNICNNNSAKGIWIHLSSSSTITNNFCKSNGLFGIRLSSSDLNFILWNTLCENGIYGLILSGHYSYNNSIHHNLFLENGQNPQGYDSGRNNHWYDETLLEGNYWSDYNGTGSYLIPGPADASDLYPFDDPSLTKKGIDLFSILIRIGLLLGIFGLLLVSIFLNKRKKSL